MYQIDNTEVFVKYEEINPGNAKLTCQRNYGTYEENLSKESLSVNFPSCPVRDSSYLRLWFLNEQ
jgi:hypothetical protein